MITALLLLSGPREDFLVGLYEIAISESDSKRVREDLSVVSQEAAVDTGTSTSCREDLSVGLQEAAVDEGKSTREVVPFYLWLLFPLFTHEIFVVGPFFSSIQECFPGNNPDDDWFPYATHH